MLKTLKAPLSLMSKWILVKGQKGQRVNVVIYNVEQGGTYKPLNQALSIALMISFSM